MAALDADVQALDGGQAPPQPPPMMPLLSLRFWINAFIPDPSMTQYVLPAPGVSAGQSMIVIPAPLPRFFLGDNRGFSTDIAASARIHSMVNIAGLDQLAPGIEATDIRCGESHEIDAAGQVIASATAPTERVRFVNLRANMSVDPEGGVIVDSPNPRFVQLDYEAAASLPLLGGSPEIDMLGVLQIDRDASIFRFCGAVDGFPAFEAYVSFNDGPIFTVLREVPIGPLEIIGDVKRPIDATIPIVT